MTARDDLDRQLDAFLRDGPTELPEPSFYAVRDRTEATGQRVVIGPWRMPDTMNKLIPIGLGAAAVVVALVIGTQLLAAPGGVGGAPAFGGTVEYRLDGAPATTDIDAVADGASVSGTAVTTFAGGTHTVRLECAADYGDTWALGGTVEESTAVAGSADVWSAVMVKDGSPQQIGIHFDAEKAEGSDCADWLAEIDYSQVDPSNYHAVESGELVPPPDDVMSRPFE
jgi:hypothetical protein